MMTKRTYVTAEEQRQIVELIRQGAEYPAVADYASRLGIHGSTARSYIKMAMRENENHQVVTPAEWQARAATLAAEVARLTADVEAANQAATRLVHELARLGIDYDGDDPLSRMVQEVAALRAQLEAAAPVSIQISRRGRWVTVKPGNWRPAPAQE